MFPFPVSAPSIVLCTILSTPGFAQSFGSIFIPTVMYQRFFDSSRGQTSLGISGSISSAYGGRNIILLCPVMLSIRRSVDTSSKSSLIDQIFEISG